MIAFAACIGDPRAYERYLAPSLGRVAEPGAPVAEITTTAICSGYNEALEAFAGYEDLAALALIHEDVSIVDPLMCAKLRRRFADTSIAVVGVIGARRVRSLCWWEGEIRGRVLESRGLIDHGAGCHDVDSVDGLLMALSPWAVRNLRFDADRLHGFHGYDVDFCFQARAAGKRVVVDDIAVVHHTRGGIGDGLEFWRADAAIRHKWSERGVPMASDAEIASVHRAFGVVSR